VGGDAEARTWDDILAMCRSGHLSLESLIFSEDTGEWRKAADTELAALIEDHRAHAAAADEDEAGQSELREQYDELLGEMEGLTGDWNKHLQLAEMAVALGDRASAVRHFQDALEANRYHPPIAQKARRLLKRDEWRGLHYLSRPEPVWNIPGALVGYPLARGPLYLAIPTVALAALSWLPGVALVAALLLYLWTTEVIRAAAAGEPRPPLWDGVKSDPVNTVLRPLGVAFIVCVELYVPFIVLATVIAMMGDSQSYAWTVIQNSPVMIVVISTLTLLYAPAVLVMANGSDRDVRNIANPRRVVSAMLKMDHEYVASVGIIAAFVAAWGILAYVLTLIPYAGRFVTVGLGLYVILTAGMVIGRLQARFSEELT
jgi:hypothetical protein